MTHYFRRVISASLSPNTQWDDVMEAVVGLASPLHWKNGSAIGFVEDWFQKFTGASYVVSFNSGRSALFALLESYEIGHRDEVIVQAFTCVAVPNAVIWCGAKPIFADIDNSLNIDPRTLSKLVTSRTKAIIVQHTLGIPAAMDPIVAFAKKHKLLVIEDCAHSIGATYKGRKVGALGDAAFFSFGRDKVLSSVWGGMAVIHGGDRSNSAIEKLKTIASTLPMPKNSWIVQQLLHPILFSNIIPLYNSGVGKLMIVLLQKLHVLSFPVQTTELQGLQPKEFPSRYPNALARLMKRQLGKLTAYGNNREEIVSFYRSSLKNKGFSFAEIGDSMKLLRFPLFVQDREVLVAKAKSQGILLGNWYSHVIDPAKSDMKKIGYTRGSCPNAEKTASKIINLPTRIALSDASRVVALLCS